MSTRRSAVAGIAAGVGWVAVGGFGLLVALLVLLSIVGRACTETPDPFVVRVIEIRGTSFCLEHVGDGPAYVDGCQRNSYIDGLPTSLAVGSCIEVVESHPIFRYVGIRECPGQEP
jgi:hypothetical protein